MQKGKPLTPLARVASSAERQAGWGTWECSACKETCIRKPPCACCSHWVSPHGGSGSPSDTPKVTCAVKEPGSVGITAAGAPSEVFWRPERCVTRCSSSLPELTNPGRGLSDIDWHAPPQEELLLRPPHQQVPPPEPSEHRVLSKSQTCPSCVDAGPWGLADDCFFGRLELCSGLNYRL